MSRYANGRRFKPAQQIRFALHVLPLLITFIMVVFGQEDAVGHDQDDTQQKMTTPTPKLTTPTTTTQNPLDFAWERFKQRFNKKYRNKEDEEQHKNNFRKSLAFINKYNSDASTKNELSLTKKADLSREERIHQLTGFIGPKKAFAKIMDSHGHSIECIGEKSVKKEVKRIMKQVSKVPTKESNAKSLPSYLDWRFEAPNRVSPIQDQGECAYSWSFAATGVIEGQKYRYKNVSDRAINLSEDNILDCSKPHTSCFSGGSAYNAFKTVERIGGIMAQDQYTQYLNKTKVGRRKCNFDRKSALVERIEGGMCLLGPTAKHIPRDDLIKTILLQYGPVATSMHAKSDAFFFHNEGIFAQEDCPKSFSQTNHELLLVGFGQKDDQNYWIVKNSWGSDWGDEGYANVAMGTCGIGTSISLALIE